MTIQYLQIALVGLRGRNVSTLGISSIIVRIFLVFMVISIGSWATSRSDYPRSGSILGYSTQPGSPITVLFGTRQLFFFAHQTNYREILKSIDENTSGIPHANGE